MKKRYAIIENDIIEEVIEADENVTEEVLYYFFPNKKIILENKKTGNALTMYHFINDKFISPKPYDSWKLVDNQWVSPVKHPNDGKFYHWNEKIKKWEIILLDE